MIDLKFTAERVLRIRRSLGLTQRGLADRLGVTQPAVCYWESGREPVGHEILSRLLELEREAEAAV